MKKIGAIVCLSVTIVCAQTFVVEKKETIKKESRSQLKQRVCQLLYDVLEGSTTALNALSQVQKSTLGWLSDFITGDKKSSIDRATDAELKALIAQLDDMVKQYAVLESKALSLISCVTKK